MFNSTFVFDHEKNRTEAEVVALNKWLLEYATLLVSKCHFPLSNALANAEAALENLNYDIELTTPEEAVDDEIEEMRACC